MNQVSGVRENSVLFMTQRTTEAYKGYRKGRWWDFDNRDLELIGRRAQSVQLIAPMLFGGGGDKNTVRGIKSGSYSYAGLHPGYFSIFSIAMPHGRIFNEVDVAERRKVCIIGKTVYETLFEKGEDPNGQVIRLNGIYFRVIGVMETGGNGFNINGPVEEQIFLPFTTCQTMFRRDDGFDILVCTTKNGYSAKQLETEVGEIVKTAHSISPTDTSALRSINVEEMFKMFKGLFIGVNALMWIVGMGALFSGIIGISNIMLVTVRERMREIGVRRALGAKPWNIIVQIMSESFVLTAIAGMVGFLLGVAASLLVDKINIGGGDVPVTIAGDPIISFNLALTAMVVLMISGMAAGLLPAWRALKIKAIDAIRDE
jgi:putative ABC transport system permease protein